jgi:hypothetical protein
VSARALALLALGAAAGCRPGPSRETSAARFLGAYFEAAQADDREALVSLVDGCVTAADRELCLAELSAARADVAAEGELGRYAFSDRFGLGLVHALVLGRGGYWSVARATGEGDELTAVVRVRTQYRADETARLPPGTEIEYLSKPLGAVVLVEKGARGPGGLRWQLDQVDLAATIRAPGTDPAAWRIVSLSPLPESAQYSQVTWRPR